MNRVSRVAIAGAGLAGLRTAMELRAAGFDGEVVLVGEEAEEPYDRPPLSKQVLSGVWSRDHTRLSTVAQLRDAGVQTLLGARVTALTPAGIELAGRDELAADVVVIATGSQAREHPDAAGSPRIHRLRTLTDSTQLAARLTANNVLILVGGGFIGAEVATAALAKGLCVTMIEAEAAPCLRALGPTVAHALAQRYAAAGVQLVTGRWARHIRSQGAADDGVDVIMDDGSKLHADDVVVGIGTVPATAWLAGNHPSGIRCDTSGRALDLPATAFAVGDVAAWPDPWGEHRRVEHWTTATDHARVVAATIAGVPPPTMPPPYFWSDQFGIKLQFTGWRHRATTTIGTMDRAGRLAYLHLDADDRVVAALTVNAPGTLARCRPWIALHETAEKVIQTLGLTETADSHQLSSYPALS